MDPFFIEVHKQFEPQISSSEPLLSAIFNGREVSQVYVRPEEQAKISLSLAEDLESSSLNYSQDSLVIEGQHAEKYESMVELYPPQKYITNDTKVDDIEIRISIES